MEIFAELGGNRAFSSNLESSLRSTVGLPVFITLLFAVVYCTLVLFVALGMKEA